MVTMTAKDFLNSSDYGFSFVDEEVLSQKATTEVQKQVDVVNQQAVDYQARLTTMFDAIMPFLNKLKESPEKAYINWPNRVAKIDEFQRRLNSIKEGK